MQVFIGFANLYQCFIQDFSKIAISLSFLLKITELFKKLVLNIYLGLIMIRLLVVVVIELIKQL